MGCVSPITVTTASPVTLTYFTTFAFENIFDNNNNNNIVSANILSVMENKSMITYYNSISRTNKNNSLKRSDNNYNFPNNTNHSLDLELVLDNKLNCINHIKNTGMNKIDDKTAILSQKSLNLDYFSDLTIVCDVENGKVMIGTLNKQISEKSNGNTDNETNDRSSKKSPSNTLKSGDIVTINDKYVEIVINDRFDCENNGDIPEVINHKAVDMTNQDVDVANKVSDISQKFNLLPPLPPLTNMTTSSSLSSVSPSLSTTSSKTIYSYSINITNSVFVLKCFRKNEKTHERISNELKIVSSEKFKSHPFVNKFYRKFDNLEFSFMVYDYVSNCDLWSILHEKNVHENINREKRPFESIISSEYSILDDDELKLPLSLIKFYMASIISVIDHLHKHGIAHRNLTPENILIDRHGYIVLISFGNSKEYPITDKNGFLQCKSFTVCGTSGKQLILD